jgi:hypothetical protein
MMMPFICSFRNKNEKVSLVQSLDVHDQLVLPDGILQPLHSVDLLDLVHLPRQPLDVRDPRSGGHELVERVLVAADVREEQPHLHRGTL